MITMQQVIGTVQRVLNLEEGPDRQEIKRSDAVVDRIQRAVVEERQADRALKDDIVRHYPQTALARALLRARDGGGVPT